jgi:hypothetical protein
VALAFVLPGRLPASSEDPWGAGDDVDGALSASAS